MKWVRYKGKATTHGLTRTLTMESGWLARNMVMGFGKPTLVTVILGSGNTIMRMDMGFMSGQTETVTRGSGGITCDMVRDQMFSPMVTSISVSIAMVRPKGMASFGGPMVTATLVYSKTA